VIDDAETQRKESIAEALRNAEEPVAVGAAPVDLKEARLAQRDALLQACDRVQMWLSPDGEVYASVPVDKHLEHYELEARGLRSWMLTELARGFRRNGRPASTTESTVRDVRMALEARALDLGIRQPTGLRLVEHDSVTYIDCGTADWSAIRVSANGWEIVSHAPIPILRGKKAASFPDPATPGDFGPLRDLLGHLDESAFILFISWCLGALSSVGPYPILILGGEQGSGKSTLARLAQRLTDPTTGDLLQPPKDDRDLIAAARQRRVLAFDNISSLSSELADSLCRLATGSEIGGRALFTDHSTATFSACRPVILNGIPDLGARGDLADRAITLRLGDLGNRITERVWQSRVEAALPSAFAALLNALSLGLKRFHEVPTPNTRMADFARLVVAAEPALPWNVGRFFAVYEGNRGEAAAAFIEGDLVASTIRSFMAGRPEGWRGYMTALWRSLSEEVPLEAKRRGDWPANARWFSDRLKRAQPVLRSIGIGVSEHRDRQGMRLTMEWIAAPAAFATELDLEAKAGTDVANVASAATSVGASGAPMTNSAVNAASAAIEQDAEDRNVRPWRVQL
jgi:hypothetical protein